jgi:2-methylisocitrate lyase-like PEP mutase family enzyme
MSLPPRERRSAIIFNVWDAGTVKTAADAGAKAIARKSCSRMATVEDGETMPLELVLATRTHVGVVDLPVSLDFEGGYAREQDKLAENIKKVIEAGDRHHSRRSIVAAEGIYCVEEQAARIRAIREAADETSVPLFINARTDIFLSRDTSTHTEEHLNESIERAHVRRSRSKRLFARHW